MTIGDANDLNTVLRYMFGKRRPDDENVDDQDLSDEAEAAAARLADRANKALAAGLTGDQVHDAWVHLQLGPWTDEALLDEVPC